MLLAWNEGTLLAGQNAYTDWVLGPGAPYLLAEERSDNPWFPIIARVVQARPSDIQNLFKSIKISSIYTSVTDAAVSHEYITALVKRDFLTDPQSKKLETIPQVVVGLPVASYALAEGEEQVLPERSLPTGEPHQGVVVTGIIDDGIAFANERFCTQGSDGALRTRIEYVWLQGAAATEGSTVLYGRELNKTQINGLLEVCSTAGLVDEDKLYRLSGLEDFGRAEHKSTAWRTSHGTHVMDLACGYPCTNAPCNRPIVCVQLPPRGTQDTSGVRLEPQVLAAIDYILDRADRVANELQCGRLPVVINFSYGFYAGPHDGTHPIEAAIDKIIAEREAQRQKVRVVLPSGNAHLARCHAQVDLEPSPSPGAEAAIDWRVLPDDQTSTFVELWLPFSDEPLRQRIELSVAPPVGPASCPPLREQAGQALELKNERGDVLCKISYESIAATGRSRFVVALPPTAFHDVPKQLAPAGIWTLKIRNVSREYQQVQLWIQRDDTPFSYPIRGRQSYFDDPEYKVFDGGGFEIEVDADCSPVRRAGSINAAGTGSDAIVVGGFLRKEEVPSRYSAGGPITAKGDRPTPHRFGPDAMAVADDSKVLPGVLAAGSRSGSVVAMNGTSVAAPQVTRLIVDELAAGGSGDRRAVQERAERDECHHAIQVKKPAPERGGAGRLVLPRLCPLDRFDPKNNDGKGGTHA
jgi:hypothetical protein